MQTATNKPTQAFIDCPQIRELCKCYGNSLEKLPRAEKMAMIAILGLWCHGDQHPDGDEDEEYPAELACSEYPLISDHAQGLIEDLLYEFTEQQRLQLIQALSHHLLSEEVPG